MGTWFSTVGKVLDQRNAKIAASLRSASENSAPSNQIITESERILEGSRAEEATLINKAKVDATAKADSELTSEQKNLDKLLADTVRALELEKQNAMSNVDSQVESLAKDIADQVND